MLGDEPSAFDPEAFEFIVSINRSFVDGPIQLEAADVVDAVIAANLFVKTNESGVEHRMVLRHGFDVADLDVLALRGQDDVARRSVFGQNVGGGELGLEPLGECADPLVLEPPVNEEAIAQEERESLTVEADAKVLGFGPQLRQDVVVKSGLHPQYVREFAVVVESSLVKVGQLLTQRDPLFPALAAVEIRNALHVNLPAE